MKRRSFLGLLGIVPAAPLLAKQIAKEPEKPALLGYIKSAQSDADDHLRLIKKSIIDLFPKIDGDTILYGNEGKLDAFCISITSSLLTKTDWKLSRGETEFDGNLDDYDFGGGDD